MLRIFILTYLLLLPASSIASFERNCTKLLLNKNILYPIALQERPVAVSGLIEKGFDPSIADRIVRYRPDLYRLIVSPQTKITPDELIIRPDFVDTFDREKWFESQRQDRTPIVVYRGLKGTGKDYDPTWYHAPKFMPELQGVTQDELGDTRIFTTPHLDRATRYSESSTIILRMQIPRFMLYELPKNKGPWGLVFFRDMIPNDLIFVTGVAFLEPGQTDNQNPNFLSLEEAMPRLSRAYINPSHQ